MLLLHSILKLGFHYLTDPVIIIMYTKGLSFVIEWLTHVICNVGVVHILKKFRNTCKCTIRLVLPLTIVSQLVEWQGYCAYHVPIYENSDVSGI